MVKDLYIEHLNRLNARVAVLKRRNPIFLTLELLSFVLFVFFLYEYFFVFHQPVFIILGIVCIVVYAVTRFFDRKNASRLSLAERIQTVYENELLYLDGDFSRFADGEKYIDKYHPFSTDMDLFGQFSLFNRMNRTVTTGGSDRLAQCLSSLPASSDEVRHRKESVDELAALDETRTLFMASSSSFIDTAKISSVLQSASSTRISPLFSSPLSLGIVYGLIVLLFVTIILSIFTPLSANVPVLLALVMLFMSLAVASKTLNRISRVVNRLTKELEGYVSLFNVLKDVEFKTDYNRHLHNQLFSEGENSLAALHLLTRILAAIDRRGNILGLIFANAFFLSDFFLVRRFTRWQQTNLSHLPQWIDYVSQFDAMMSMATYRFNHPEAVDAEVLDADKIVYEATELYHPFIGKEKAVRNDFKIDDGTFYIITGANMAGKSTFLRSLGINYILAMNGMPVFAQSLKVSMFNIFTSMCTTDDLTHGISYFNAELIRLQQLISSCKESEHTLIILDEILKGTNSLDKLNGSRLFLESISSLPVSGVIATHDLELSKMEDSDPDHFHNYCFEVELGDDVTYSYRVTPGVARNQNATFLLNKILNDL